MGIGKGGEGGGGSGIHFIHNNALQRPGQGQITFINDATRANFEVCGAHLRDFPWTGFLGCRKEGY